jgi:rSAM/selenodomain-associated transferase 2
MTRATPGGPRLSVIIPTLNEADHIDRVLEDVSQGDAVEVIVADGGSIDTTVAQAAAHGACIIQGPAGRARQMNQGAAMARGGIFFFLHADSRLPTGYDRVIRRALAKATVAAGAFSLGIDADAKNMRIVEYWANLRSRYLSLPYGDQGMFLRAARFQQCGGFPELPIMEDFAMMRHLKKTGRIVTVPERIYTSSRRWRRMGVLRTTLINQAIISGYLMGIPAHRLARWYRRSGGIDRTHRSGGMGRGS